ncbi:hypothetical protein [Flavobacterium sp. J49]|nr:hypothetical protein [Flavobacterium sp. J49]
MDYYWNIIALAIGYYYAWKNGVDAQQKINKYFADKEDKQNAQ